MDMAPPPLDPSTLINSQSPSPHAPPPPPHLPNIHNPLPLSASQEAAVRTLYHARVRKLCDPEIGAFARCAAGKTFSAMWTCRELRLAMNGCMVAHATKEEEDRAREEWFSTRAEKRKERERESEEVERRKREVREWWKGEEEKRLRREREEREAKRSHMDMQAPRKESPQVGSGIGDGDGIEKRSWWR